MAGYTRPRSGGSPSWARGVSVLKAKMGSGTLLSAKSDGEPGTLVLLALNLTIRFQEGAEV
jgi:hypothetical protein